METATKEFKGTKGGKWMFAYSSSKQFEVVCDKPNHGAMGTMDETLVAKMAWMNNMTKEEVIANAKLIAAAPDLLEALQTWEAANALGDAKLLAEARIKRGIALEKALG